MSPLTPRRAQVLPFRCRCRHVPRPGARPRSRGRERWSRLRRCGRPMSPMSPMSPKASTVINGRTLRVPRSHDARYAQSVSPLPGRVRLLVCGRGHGQSVSSGRSTSSLSSPRVARSLASARRLTPYQLGVGRCGRWGRVPACRADTKRRAGASGEPPVPDSLATALRRGGHGPVSSVLPRSTAPPPRTAWCMWMSREVLWNR